MYILLYDLFGLYNANYLYVFRADHGVLGNQLAEDFKGTKAQQRVPEGNLYNVNSQNANMARSGSMFLNPRQGSIIYYVSNGCSTDIEPLCLSRGFLTL